MQYRYKTRNMCHVMQIMQISIRQHIVDLVQTRKLSAVKSTENQVGSDMSNVCTCSLNFRGRDKDSGGGGGGGGGQLELGSSVTLTDSVGQRLEVLLENRLGEGGQRHVVVYCPVWMVNTSHYCLRYYIGTAALV